MSANAPVEEIESVIARTALKYDLLPYQSKPFAQSQPSRLGAIAQLFGLDVAPLATARVLELGCASGGNIIPLAILYPKASFIGVDLARTQVAAGRSRIARLGLNNVEIRCQSFTEIGEELGSFDYIICHGVYSWVPAAVQDAIFKIIRARLSPLGVACVSYNVLPGWRMLQPLRDAFLLEVPDHIDSLGRVAKARELLTFLSMGTPNIGPYGDMLRIWAERMSTLPDDYLAHEFLEEMNSPSTVRDFAANALRNGLGFLAECELASMILENYGADLAQQVRARSGNDLIESEQYLDLLTGRTFRQTLLIANERMATVNRTLGPDSIERRHFLTQPGMHFGRDGDKYLVTDAAGRTLSTDSSAVAEGVARLVERFPSSSSLDDCAEAIPDASEADRQLLFDALYRMTLAGIVTLSSEPIHAGVAGEHPKAIALARTDAADGSQSTTNVRHETIALDPATSAILPAMDGTLDHNALARLLASKASSGQFNFYRDGEIVTSAEGLNEIANEHFSTVLAGLANAGLLA